jgi:hypothetical protein
MLKNSIQPNQINLTSKKRNYELIDSLSWETNSRSVSREILRLLWSPTTHCVYSGSYALGQRPLRLFLVFSAELRIFSENCWWSFQRGDTTALKRPPTGLLFNPQVIWVWRTTVECYRHGKLLIRPSKLSGNPPSSHLVAKQNRRRK